VNVRARVSATHDGLENDAEEIDGTARLDELENGDLNRGVNLNPFFK
jgi:hypothetical protein